MKHVCVRPRQGLKRAVPPSQDQRGAGGADPAGGTISFDSVAMAFLPILQVVTFDTWTERVQLNCLRKQLSAGFQIHFRDNDVIRQIFDLGKHVGKSEKTTMSKHEKRMYKSKNSDASKQRTQRRNQARDKRRNVNNDILMQ